jgi:AhpD family alkylhydroperoxidase
MPAGVLRPVLGMLGLTQIRHVAPVRRGQATGLVARVYRQVEADFGVLAPPIALHACAPQTLAAAWVLLRESLVVPGTVSRVDKEAVAAAVSRQNACPYCVTIHGSVMTRLGARGPVPPPAGGDPEVTAMVLVMHYLNRMVNVFLRDVPLPPGVPDMALKPVMRVLGTDLLAAAQRRHAAGASVDLLPGAALPEDLSWAARSGSLAPALARACAMIEVAGQRSVPGNVRTMILDALSDWHGEARGISRAWTADVVAALPDDQKAAGRLALLVTFASFQVDAGVVQSYRSTGADDAAIMELSAWSALAAARRMGVLAWSGTPGQ